MELMQMRKQAAQRKKQTAQEEAGSARSRPAQEEISSVLGTPRARTARSSLPLFALLRYLSAAGGRGELVRLRDPPRPHLPPSPAAVFFFIV